jgi:hypothetical protein
VATIDDLWTPLLAHHFGDVVLPASVLPLGSAHRFNTLALIPCSVCDKILLPPEPKVDPVWSRYSAPRSCGICGLPCCATCHCRCRCLDEECDVAELDRHYNYNCGRCRAWAHKNCYHLFSMCTGCRVCFCFACASEVLVACETCSASYCRACQRNWSVLGNICLCCFEEDQQGSGHNMLIFARHEHL